MFVVYSIQMMPVLCEIGVETCGDERLIEVLMRKYGQRPPCQRRIDRGIDRGVDEQPRMHEFGPMTSNRKSGLWICVTTATKYLDR